MILSVRFEETTYQGIPHKFEAGTPDIAGVIGLGAAIDYVTAIGLDAIAAHEHELLRYASEQLARVPGLRLIGTAREKAAVISFVLEGVHAHDVGTILDQHGIAVRTGHHCAQPVMERYGVPATVRASFALYNTRADVDALVRGLGPGARGLRLMSDLRELYQSVILDHNKAPRNLRRPADANRSAEGRNPLCGDQLTVFLDRRGRRGEGRRLRGLRLRDLDGLRLADDREREGPARGGGREDVRRLPSPA